MRSMVGMMSSSSWTKAVLGMPMRWRLRIWIDRSLSRETLIAWDEFTQKTPICSN